MFENLVLRRSFCGKNSGEIFGATISYKEKNSPSARKIAINKLKKKKKNEIVKNSSK